MKIEKSCGAVLFTLINGNRHYVLVTSLGGHCGMPKGHVEPGESEKETALREIYEETGINAEIIQGFRMQVEYMMSNEVMKEVVFFAARYEGQTPKNNPIENLNVVLLPYKDALDAITTFEITKSVLKEAEVWLTRK